jgi:hypothetical protein
MTNSIAMKRICTIPLRKPSRATKDTIQPPQAVRTDVNKRDKILTTTPGKGIIFFLLQY